MPKLNNLEDNHPDLLPRESLKPRKSQPQRAISLGHEYFFPGVLLKSSTNDPNLVFNRHNIGNICHEISSPTLDSNTDAESFHTKESDQHIMENLRDSLNAENLQENTRFCLSCGTSKTPYWRESWMCNNFLCNACGLRFSKFKKKCSKCLYIPRKEDKTSQKCPMCRGIWS